MRIFVMALLLLAATATAQTPSTAKKAPAKKPEPKIKPLPKGQTRVFEAIVMKVVGVAQARADRKAKWKKLKVNDVLKPGVLVYAPAASRSWRCASGRTRRWSSTGRRASSIPQIVQNGETLQARASASSSGAST